MSAAVLPWTSWQASRTVLVSQGTLVHPQDNAQDVPSGALEAQEDPGIQGDPSSTQETSRPRSTKRGGAYFELINTLAPLIRF